MCLFIKFSCFFQITNAIPGRVTIDTVGKGTAQLQVNLNVLMPQDFLVEDEKGGTFDTRKKFGHVIYCHRRKCNLRAIMGICSLLLNFLLLYFNIFANAYDNPTIIS